MDNSEIAAFWGISKHKVEIWIIPKLLHFGGILGQVLDIFVPWLLIEGGNMDNSEIAAKWVKNPHDYNNYFQTIPA